MALQLYPHISADARILSGQPVIDGTSIAVSLVVSEVAAGKNLHDIAQEHRLSIEDVRAALEYAAQRTSEPVAVAVDAKNEESTGQADAKSAMAEEEARRLGLDPTHLSPLGRRLLELRAQAIAAGEPLLTTWEELDAEIAKRRGGIYPDADA